MTPEEAERFYEADEDPEEIFAKFDAGRRGVTAAPAPEQASVRVVSTYAVATGLYGELRRRLLPEVSATGPSSYMSGRA
jgi:hypothetical protein